MKKIFKITVLLLFGANLSAQQILREGGRLLTGSTTGQVAVFNAGTGTWSAGTDQNGPYTGNGTVPNGTVATLANDFTFAGTDNTGTQDPALRVTATGTNPGIVSFIVSTDSVMLSRVSSEFRQIATGAFRLQADGINILSNDGLTLQGDSLILQAGVTEDVTQNMVLSINTATNRVRRKPMHLSQTVSSGSSSIQASRTVVYVNNIAASATITLPDPATNVNNPVTIARYDATSVGTITITSAGTPLIEDLAAYTYGTSTTLGTDAGNRRATFMSDGTRYHIVMTGGSGGGGGGSSTTTLDDAYNNFAATASKINVDAAQGQTGGLEIESTGSNNITLDLQGTGDFIVQDAGTAIVTINDSGNAGIGPYAPNSSQRLVVSNTTTSTVTTPLRVANGGTLTDGGGTSFAIENNGFDKFIVTASNPSGSYTNQVSLSASSSQEHIRFTEDINETRFKQATSRDVTTGTATTYQVDGRSSVIRIPTSATTTTITLPEIVTGDATTNQVNVGYELFLSVNRSVSVNINRAGSDIILVDGATGSYTTLATTASTIFAKRLIATDVNEWTIYQ